MTGPGLDSSSPRGSRLAALYAIFLQPPIIVFASEASRLPQVSNRNVPDLTLPAHSCTKPRNAQDLQPQITLSLPSMHPKPLPRPLVSGQGNSCSCGLVEEHGSDAGPLCWPSQSSPRATRPEVACLLSKFISTEHLVCICYCPLSPWMPYLRVTWNSTTASMIMLSMSIKPTKVAPNSARRKCAPPKHSMYVTPACGTLELRRRLTLLQRYIPFLPTIAFDATLQSSWEALSVSFQAGLLNGGPVRNPLD
jgi:hypothetical protein